MKRPTLKDIARKAGVGAGTVSRVINNQPYVKEETRQRVLDAIAELDYRPSFSARHMRTQRSRLIGFLTDEIATSPYAGDIVKGAEEAAWGNDFILLMISAGDSLVRARQAIDAMLEREVEGIIYAAMYHRSVEVPHNIYETPTVLANCYIEDSSLPSVVPNEFFGGYQATTSLLEKGHTSIGFINVHTVNPGIPASRGRLKGYRQAIEDHGLEFDENLVLFGDGTPESGYTHGLKLMQLPHPPTSIFCGNDRTAMGLYDALRKSSLHIPDDVAVVGFDNMDIIASALHPSLSTMQLPHYEMGKWALNFLIEHLKDEGAIEVKQHKLDCPFVQRNSI